LVTKNAAIVFQTKSPDISRKSRKIQKNPGKIREKSGEIRKIWKKSGRINMVIFHFKAMKVRLWE
jgi:transposase